MTSTPETLLGQAVGHKAAGRWAEAAAAYSDLLTLMPDMPDTWFNLGLMQRRAGRPQAALEAYRQALERGVLGPEEAHLNRAVIFSDDLGDSEAALAELTRALAIAPYDLAALLNLGNLREDRGEREQARTAYRRALEVAPGHPLALSRLANATVFESIDDPLIDALRQGIARPGADAADRAELGFALTRALDSVGEHEAAFAAAIAANADSRAFSGATYDPAAHDARVDRTMAAFNRPLKTGDRSDPEPSAPIFILGLFRSGSTLVERILAAHPRVTSGGELALMPRLVQTIGDDPATVAEASPETVSGWRKTYLDALATARPGAALVTDKRPDNFLHIGLIKAMFPDARIIHTNRDPMDVGLSNLFLHLDGSMAYAGDLADTGHWIRAHDRLMAHWKSVYPDDILTVDYDVLVRAPRQAIEQVLAFCGLEWDDACLDFHKAGGAVRTASVWQVREPLYQRSSGRWRAYKQHLGPLRAALDAA
ncbi:tetratricopeptide repeat-containing sulfotransferase family protein [Brevundimonas variabilis]|uniref:Flp pilus assembly protein TadD n=1 Tax=Brevundimonas variabilis TaxID=74312 RepID=A0A7W9CJL0_9CAUL|nr:sulfotransferase [Brevundimonas variabilis]MBB5746646.1 Flp pilus assembly protein TadD [Brevundimonas variabilis]